MANTPLTIGFIPFAMAEFDAVLDVADVRTETVPSLDESPEVKRMKDYLETLGKVAYPGPVGNVEAAAEARKALLAADIDVLIIHLMHYTLDLTILKTVEGLNVPIILWHTQPFTTLPDSLDFGQVMANDATSSLPETTNVLMRKGLSVKVITGNETSPEVDKRIRQEIDACRIVKNLRGSKIGIIGYGYPGMKTMGVDEIQLIHKLGLYTEQIQVRELIAIGDRLTDSQIQEVVTQIESNTVTGLSEKELYYSAKSYLALKQAIENHNVDCVAFLCPMMIMEESFGVAPCYAAGRLTAEGIPFICEADIPAAVSTLLVKELTAPIFTEMYSMDMEKEYIVTSHCGMGNLSTAANPVTICPQPCFPGPNGCGAALQYSTGAGEVTMTGFTTDDSGKFRIIAYRMEAFERTPFPTHTPQVFLRFKGISFIDGVEDLCKTGISHHFTIGYGDLRPVLQRVAAYLGIDFRSNL